MSAQMIGLLLLSTCQLASANFGYAQLPTNNVQPAASAYGAPAPMATGYLSVIPSMITTTTRQTTPAPTTFLPSTTTVRLTEAPTTPAPTTPVTSSSVLYSANDMNNMFPVQTWNAGYMNPMSHVYQPNMPSSQYGSLYQLPAHNAHAQFPSMGYGSAVQNIGHPYIMYRQPYISNVHKASTSMAQQGYDISNNDGVTVSDTATLGGLGSGYGYNQPNVYDRVPVTSATRQAATTHRGITVTTAVPTTVVASNDPWAALAASTGSRAFRRN